MDICEFYEFAKEAMEHERIEIHRAQWNALYPFMVMKRLKYFSFKDYYDMCLGRNVDMRPAEDIIAEIEELHNIEKGGIMNGNI